MSAKINPPSRKPNIYMVPGGGNKNTMLAPPTSWIHDGREPN